MTKNNDQDENSDNGFLGWLTGNGSKSTEKDRNSENSDSLGSYIDLSETQNGQNDEITDHEKLLLNNILRLRDISVVDVMVPRADIAAVDVNVSREDLLRLLSERTVSRLPVYEDNLDNVLGSIHIKDILAAFNTSERINIRDFLIDIPIVSPAMPILDLILEMRINRRHMALVIDEHGGIDGLVTLGDIIEKIVGEIEDEHDTDEPMMEVSEDGSIIADARLHIEDLEEEYGSLITDDERDEVDTLNGLLFMIAGRIPDRGEVLKHKNSGMVFEVLDADPRRVHRLRIRNIPKD